MQGHVAALEDGAGADREVFLALIALVIAPLPGCDRSAKSTDRAFRPVWPAPAFEVGAGGVLGPGRFERARGLKSCSCLSSADRIVTKKPDKRIMVGCLHTEAIMSSAPVTLVGIFAVWVFAIGAAAQAADTDQITKAERAAPKVERTTSQGCPDAAPLSCPGTDTCCPSGTPNLCQSLTRNHPAGIAPAG
jgi:tetrahydromethanopterin S-methyltransferase subunit D